MSIDEVDAAPGGVVRRLREWRHRRKVAAALLVVAGLAGWFASVVARDSTPAPTGSTTATTTLLPGGSGGGVPHLADLDRVIWPIGGPTPYFDPSHAAQVFAVSFLHMPSPLVAAVRSGGARAREVDLRPARSGPLTTVRLERLPGQPWWSVVGVATPQIVVADPAPDSAIRSPVFVHGLALAFDGTVDVEVRQDGRAQTLGTSVVTGGGDVMRPFSGSVAFSASSRRMGTIVLFERSAADGTVMQATAVRVRFIR